MATVAPAPSSAAALAQVASSASSSIQRGGDSAFEESSRTTASSAGSITEGDPDEQLLHHDPSPIMPLTMRFDPSQGISRPNPSDVICGRGKATSTHQGNERFRALIRQHQDRYQKAERREDKTQISDDLVEKLRQEGSRFVLFDPVTNMWYKVSTDYAKEKVSHSLRSRQVEGKASKEIGAASTSKRGVARGHGSSPSSKRKKTGRKPSLSSSTLDELTWLLIRDQQALFKSMMEQEKRQL